MSEHEAESSAGGGDVARHLRKRGRNLMALGAIEKFLGAVDIIGKHQALRVKVSIGGKGEDNFLMLYGLSTELAADLKDALDKERARLCREAGVPDGITTSEVLAEIQKRRPENS